MATDVGQLVYTLTLNDEGFQGQLNEAKGQVTGSSDEMAASSEKAGSAFSGMAGQFVIGQAIFMAGQKALALVTDTVKDGIKSYEDYQNAQAQLANALKNTKDASGQSLEGLNKYADGLSSQTGITGNAVNAAQEVLLKYTAIGGTVFPEATKQVANLATAMSGGAVPTSQAMSQAAQMLGIALDDPAKGMARLRRSGVVLSTQQQDQIKQMEAVGNMAGAQQALLSDLNDVVGGKAVTAAHTLAGEQAQLHAQMEKVEIEVGQKLAAAFKAIEPYLLKFADWVMHHKVVLAGLVGALGALAIVITIGLVTALWSAVAGFIGLSAAALPWIALGVAIGAIAYEIISHWNDLKQWFDDFINFVKQIFNDGLDFIKQHWALIVDIILGPLGIVITTVIQHWQQIKDGFADALSFVKSIWSGITGFFAGLWNGITSTVGKIGTVLSGAFRDAFNAVIGLWDDTMGKIFHGQKISVGPVHFDLPNLNIPKMAEGGIVDSATLALIGEAGPEAVVPLNKAGSQLGNVTYNFAAGSVVLSTAEAVDEFFNIGNRNLQLETNGISPLAGTAGV